MHPRTLLLVALVVLAGCSASPDTSATDAGTATELTTVGATATEATTDRVATTRVTTADRTKVTNLAEATDRTAAADSASARSDCPPRLYLEAVDRPSNEAVHAYGNLSAERKAEFDTALVEGHADIRDEESYEFWVDRPYVEHDGNVYRAVVAVC